MAGDGVVWLGDYKNRIPVAIAKGLVTLQHLTAPHMNADNSFQLSTYTARLIGQLHSKQSAINRR